MFVLNQELGANINAGLPNLTGKFRCDVSDNDLSTGGTKYEGLIWGAAGVFNGGVNSAPAAGDGRAQFYVDRILKYPIQVNDVISFDASRSNEIYGKSTTVQPPAYTVTFFRRIS